LGIKKEKGKERKASQEKKKTPISSEKLEIMFSSFFLINCSVDMQG
jgi:hypothetical protein